MKQFITKYHKSVIVLLLFFLLVVLLQWHRGAFQNECGTHSDEAAHYVSGLMVRDYLLSLSFKPPMSYAESYYIHYPKIALGHWPPFFYIIQVIWGLLFSQTRTSILLFLALLTAILASLVFRAVRDEFGDLAGLAAGLIFILLPAIQISNSRIMAAIPLALLVFGAALYYGKFLDTMRWRHVVGFTILATLAVLTKGNGLVLALLPPFAVLISRRLYLFCRWRFWFPAVVVFTVCAPLYWLTRGMMEFSFHKQVPTLTMLGQILGGFSFHLMNMLGIALSLVAAIGLASRVITPCWSREIQGKWASAGALLLSVWLFHCFVIKSVAARFMVSAVPVLVMFLIAGMASIAKKISLPRLAYNGKMAALILVALLFLAEKNSRMPLIAWYGFSEVAEDFLSMPEFEDSVVLISSDARGDGMFIAEVASREERPKHIILRADKVLSTSTWHGGNYTLLFKTPQEIMTYLKSIPVGVVIIDLSVPMSKRTEHQRLLKNALEIFSQHWELIASYPIVRKAQTYPDAVRMYRLIDHENQPRSTLSIDMHKTLGRTIKQ